MDLRTKQILYLAIGFSTVLLPISSGDSLFLGVFFALFVGNPFIAQSKTLSKVLLQVSVVGLGAGIQFGTILVAGRVGFVYTLIGIVSAMGVGLLLGKRLHLNSRVATLISSGTAICGGSAIAAVAPVVGATSAETSLSLAVVFILNSVALFLFPMIGQSLSLSPEMFGLWDALSVHDTSSVVGAALQYSEQSVAVATTIKLARALWIVPLTLAVAYFGKASGDGKKFTFPWFILGFIGMAALFGAFPAIASIGSFIAMASRRLLVATLFLIGSGLTLSSIREVGPMALLHGVLLWIWVGTTSLLGIYLGWISL